MEQELNQTGVAEEQPQEETSKDVSQATSTEEKATSQDGIRKLQSMKDKAEWEAKKNKDAFDTVQAQVQELQEALRQQRLDTQRKEIEALTGDPDGQAAVRRKYELDERENRLREEERRQKDAIHRMFDQAAKLAKEHNLNPGDLLDAKDPDSMDLLAKNLILQREIEAMKQASGPKGGFKPDSGTSDASVDSDESFLKKWNSGEMPVTKENLTRATKIIS